MARKKRSGTKTSSSPRMTEVTDLQAESTGPSGLTIELGLIFATTMTLVVGWVLAQMCLKKYFDGGLFG